MKTTLIGALACALIIFSTSASAENFDCVRPVFGVSMESIPDHQFFVKYKESGGVAYYNYTGPCRLAMHEHVAPTIVYGFVGDKLYSRIIHTFNDDIEMIKKHMLTEFGTPRIVESGDWLTLTWGKNERNLKNKVKFNLKTREAKWAMYFEPLRPAGDKEPTEATIEAPNGM